MLFHILMLLFPYLKTFAQLLLPVECMLSSIYLDLTLGAVEVDS